MSKRHLEEYLGTFDQYKILELDEQSKMSRGVLLKVGGVFQVEDAKNKNERIYPKETWDSVFSDGEWTEKLGQRGILGEIDHPSDGGRLRRTSHIVTKLERRTVNGTSCIYGEAEILDVPDGRILETLFRARARVGISSRGEGTVERDEEKSADVVKKDYRPEAFDFVTNPSTHGAYPTPLSESEEKNFNVILSAFSDLIENTSDKRVLLSCMRVLESYRAEEKAQELLSTLEQKLVAEASLNPNTEPIEVQEDSCMSDKISKEAMEELHQMARDLAAKEIASLTESHEKALNEKTKGEMDLSRELRQTQKRLDAAKEIIEAYHNKVREVKTSNSSDTTLRLEAAKKLLGAALEELTSMRKTKKYAEAAEKVAQALMDRRDSDKLNGYLDRVLSPLGEMKNSFRKLIGNVSTIKEAKERVHALRSLIPNKKVTKKLNSREPLPGQKVNINLTESARKNIKATSDTLTSVLWNRIAQ